MLPPVKPRKRLHPASDTPPALCELRKARKRHYHKDYARTEQGQETRRRVLEKQKLERQLRRAVREAEAKRDAAVAKGEPSAALEHLNRNFSEACDQLQSFLESKKPKRMVDPDLDEITDESLRLKVIKRQRERDRRERLRQEAKAKSQPTANLNEAGSVIWKENAVGLLGSLDRFRRRVLIFTFIARLYRIQFRFGHRSRDLEPT